MGVRTSHRLLCVVLAAGIGGCGAGAATTTSAPRPKPRRSAPKKPVAVALRVTPAGRLPAPVQAPATTAVGGHALLMGGLDEADTSTSDVFVAGAAGSRKLGTLPYGLHDAAAATIGSTAYLIGGGEPSLNQIISVDRRARSSVVGYLPAAASDVAAATVGRTVYIVGGYTGTEPLETIVAWTGSVPTRIVARLPHPIRYAAVASAGGKLIIVGGTSGESATADVYSFDPTTRRVRRIAVLNRPITHAAAATLNGLVYVIGGRGGYEGTQRPDIFAVNPATGHVRGAGRLPVALSDVGAATVGHTVIVAGGRQTSGAPSDRVFLLRPMSTS